MKDITLEVVAKAIGRELAEHEMWMHEKMEKGDKDWKRKSSMIFGLEQTVWSIDYDLEKNGQEKGAFTKAVAKARKEHTAWLEAMAETRKSRK